MSKKHKFPTVSQLEQGVVVECAGSGDEALEDMQATHVKLTLIEGTEDDFEGAAEDEELAALILVLARPPGRKRWLFTGMYPMGFLTPWDEDDEGPLHDYLDRLVDARDLEDDLIDASAVNDDDEDWDEEEDDEDDEEEDEDDEDSPLVHVDGAAEFKREVLDAKLPVLVDFTAVWCGPCQELTPRLVDLAEEREGDLKVVKVNIDDNEDLAGKYGVEAVPTVVLFNKGKKVARDEGFTGKKALISFVDKHLSH